VLPEPHTLAVFALAAIALAAVPGPAVLYIVAQSVGGGRVAGLFSALGVATGGAVHVAAAAIGLSSLLVSSALAFEVVKYAGAAYLVFLGVRRLLARDDEPETPGRAARPARSPWSLYRQGVVVNVLNPKTAIFFLAFIPQFVDPGNGAVPGQIAILGVVFVAVALASDSAYALAAGTAGGLLRGSRRYLQVERWVSGSVFVGLGLATALSGARRTP
jgi:threonine/homoserine/homoserine lactone efflux protein